MQDALKFMNPMYYPGTGELFFCHRCGGFAASNPVKLAEPCIGYRTDARKPTMRNLKKQPPKPSPRICEWHEPIGWTPNSDLRDNIAEIGGMDKYNE